VLALLGADGTPELNRKVLEYARSQRGRRVGDGECTALAVAALRQAGARRLPPYGRDEDYVWGEEVPIHEARPGDVLQFRAAVFKGSRRSPGGRRLWTYTFPHHTAIVSGVGQGGAGTVLTILHQNAGPSKDEAKRRIVQEGTITLAELQPGGRVRAYRPVPDAPLAPGCPSEPSPP
jgi:hypothetical protein